MNETSSGFEPSPPYPSTTPYNGVGSDVSKIPNGSWQGPNTAAEAKLMGITNNPEALLERNNWNPAFPPLGYKRPYSEPSNSTANNMKKEPNGVYPLSDASEPPQHDKSPPFKPKTWGSPGGSDAGKVK